MSSASMANARKLSKFNLTDLEREVFEELARKNPGTSPESLCAHSRELGGMYSFSYWSEPSLTDISPLVRLGTLESLHVVNNPAFSDLSPLAECPHLKEVEVYGTAVADLLPLAGHPALEKIVLSDTLVKIGRASCRERV